MTPVDVADVRLQRMLPHLRSLGVSPERPILMAGAGALDAACQLCRRGWREVRLGCAGRWSAADPPAAAALVIDADAGRAVELALKLEAAVELNGPVCLWSDPWTRASRLRVAVRLGLTAAHSQAAPLLARRRTSVQVARRAA